jgi:hypothetical protein
MATYTVTRVRKERSADGSHEHIEGVCTVAGVYYSRDQVVESIASGNNWRTDAGGFQAIVAPVDRCPHEGCEAAPYITTNPNSRLKDNLENLDPC